MDAKTSAKEAVATMGQKVWGQFLLFLDGKP